MKTKTPLQQVIAYQQAEYRVSANKRDFILKVGQVSHPLAALYDAFQSDNATFITACNPQSCLQTLEQNLQKQQQLQHDIQNTTCHFFYGTGIDPAHHWPDENSLLVLNLGYRRSFQLAKKYQQNAFLWCDNRAIPELVWVR